MAIFSSLLKSPSDPPSVRVVPNGGLGGLVQFDIGPVNKGDKSGDDSENDGGNEGRRKPPPLLVTNLDMSAGARTAPLAKLEENLHEPIYMPRSAHQASSPTSMSSIEDEVGDLQNMSSRLFWQRTKMPDPLRQHAWNKNTSAASQSGSQTSPVELPGSFPIPNQAVNTASSSGLTLPKTGRARAYSEKSHIAPRNRLLVPADTSPADMENLKSALRLSHKNKSGALHGGDSLQPSPITTPVTATLPSIYTSRTRDINSLNVEDLLKVLPKLKSKTIVKEWIPAMEKEFAKIKSLLIRYQNQEIKDGRIITAFADDMHNLLETARDIASRYDKVIQEAQAEVDTNKQTDLEKLQAVQSKLQGAILAYKHKIHHNRIQDQKYEELKRSLNEVVSILGGFIRNKLAHTLHNTEEGLTKEVIRILRTFDRESEQAHKKVFASNVSAENHEKVCALLEETQEKYDNAQQLVREQQELAQNTSSQLDNLLAQLQARSNQREQMEADIACLNSQLEAEREQNEHYRKKILALQDKTMKALPPTPVLQDHEQSIKEVEKDVDILCQQHSEEMEQANEVIKKQQLQIEELTRGMACFPGGVAGNLPSSSTTIEITKPGRLFGSKKLKKAMLPVSRSMSNLLSPLDFDRPSKKQASASSDSLVETPRRVGLPANMARSPVVAGPVRCHGGSMSPPVLQREQFPGRLLAEERILPARRRRPLSEIEEAEVEDAAVGEEVE